MHVCLVLYTESSFLFLSHWFTRSDLCMNGWQRFSLATHTHWRLNEDINTRTTSNSWENTHPAPVRSALELLRAVFSPHYSSLSTRTTAHLKTPRSLIGLIQDGDESAYRQEVKELAVWCSLNIWLSFSIHTGHQREPSHRKPTDPVTEAAELRMLQRYG